MIEEKKIKSLCEQLYQHAEEGCHFSYVFDQSIVIGCIMDISMLGIAAGTNNNIIGPPSKCADLFYAQVLIYVAQIKAILGYTSEQAVLEISKRLFSNLDMLDEVKAIIGFKTQNMHNAGSA